MSKGHAMAGNSCAILCKLMTSVDLPLYQRVGIKMVIIDQEGFWSVFQESVDHELEVLKNEFLQQRYRDVS